MPNRGGFSWKRALGVTRAKQRISRATGIPLTKSGRQRKIGKMVTGGGCIINTIIIALFGFGVTTAIAASMYYVTYLPLIMRPENTPTYTATAEATPTPMPTATPTPTPIPVPLPGENLRCNTVGNAQICATISDSTPDKYSWLTVRGRLIIGGVPQVDKRMYTTWHFKTTTSYCNDGYTNSDGIASCTYYISGASSGYQVNIDVTIDGYSVRTWFTTN